MSKRISKMLFSKERVELSLVDDLKKLNSTYYGNTDNANSLIKGLLSEARKAESKIDEAIKSSNKMEAIVSKVQQQAKELGVDSKNIKELQDAERAIKDSKEYKQVLATIKKFISSI